MKSIFGVVLLAYACFAQTQTFNPPVRFLSGTSAPSSGACDSASEVGAFYVKTGNPASITTQIYWCTQTGSSSYAWNPFFGKVQTAAPATCAVGDLWFDSNASAGSNLNLCTATDTWTPTSSGGGGTPGGSNTEVQYNDTGAFAGDPGLTYDSASNELTVTGGVNVGDGTVAGKYDLLELTANGSNYRRLMVSDSLSTDVNVKFFEGTLPTNNDCVKASVSGSTVSQEGAGGPCATYAAYTSLVDGATISWNVSSVALANATVTLGGNRTLNVSNLVNGGTYLLVVKQDATGSRTLTLGTGCTWKVINGGGGTITPSTTANAADILAFSYDGTSCWATYGKNYN